MNCLCACARLLQVEVSESNYGAHYREWETLIESQISHLEHLMTAIMSMETPTESGGAFLRVTTSVILENHQESNDRLDHRSSQSHDDDDESQCNQT